MDICSLQSLERKRAMNEVIKAASAKKDHLSAFPSFHCFHRDGILISPSLNFHHA